MLRNKKFIITITSLILVLAISFGAFALYASDYYRAEADTIKAFAAEAGMSVSEFIREYIFTPEKGVIVGGEKDAN